MKKILLIDGNLLLFKSFYAAQAISKNVGNMPTHLFLNSFVEIINDLQPSFVFFAFDGKEKTKRHLEYEEYKAGRTKAPDELYSQKEIIRGILSTMNITNVAHEGDEADDLIATICNKYKNDHIVKILSDDKDLLQLVDNNVSIIVKNRDKSINKKFIEINTNNFFEKFQFNPSQVTDYKGIAGDSSDNLQGIKGIGPKTAIDLLGKFNSLENIYNNLDSLKERQRQLFLENKDYAFMCKRLATLNSNVNFDFNLDMLKLTLNDFYNENVFSILEKYNLRKILNIIKLLKNQK